MPESPACSRVSIRTRSSDSTVGTVSLARPPLAAAAMGPSSEGARWRSRLPSSRLTGYVAHALEVSDSGCARITEIAGVVQRCKDLYRGDNAPSNLPAPNKLVDSALRLMRCSAKSAEFPSRPPDSELDRMRGVRLGMLSNSSELLCGRGSAWVGPGLERCLESCEPEPCGGEPRTGSQGTYPACTQLAQ